MTTRTTVHLLRHGEVDNPRGILYGRMPGFHLSERGRDMAQLATAFLAARDVTVIVSSPLERARETAEPLVATLGVPLRFDDRLLEAHNVFEGRHFEPSTLKEPAVWPYLVNPLRPSWGEPYAQVAARMRGVIRAARDAALGHEAVLVSHQLPIWIARRKAERRRLFHDPRSRQCGLASVTSLTYAGDELVRLTYAEPARSLYPVQTPVAGA